MVIKRKNINNAVFLRYFIVFVFIILFISNRDVWAAAKTGQKIYEVTFLDSNGKSNQCFEELKTTVKAGKFMVLPDAAAKKNAVFAGWATKKKSEKAEYKQGSSYKPDKSITFYAVYIPNVTVTYLSNDGSKIYKTIVVGKGTTLKISGRLNEEGYTFLGWNDSPKTSLNPQYLVGKNLKVTEDMKLYAVQYKKNREYDYTDTTLPQIDTKKYTKVIFVGDSRTYRMRQTLEAQFEASKYKGAKFIAKGGATLSWFDEIGYKKLMQTVGEGGTKNKPIAIVFNLGVNDLQDIDDYIVRLRLINQILTKKNCKLFYMSVNPLNNQILLQRGSKDRPESAVHYFNSKIQSQLCSATSITYIDTFSYLMKKGYCFDSGRGEDSGIEDGIHYSAKTYKKIYAYVIDTLNTKG